MACAVLYRGELVRMGGNSGDDMCGELYSYSHIQKYSLSRKTWSLEENALPCALSGHAAILYKAHTRT
jgi:hypothetical protein